MTDAGPPQKRAWWLDVLIAFVVAFVVSAYYGAKLSVAQKRADQTEARLAQAERAQAKLASAGNGDSSASSAPPNLFCPDGTTLQRFVSLNEFMEEKQGKESAGHWECIGKPLVVGDVVDGYRFKGGEPLKQANWEKLKRFPQH